MLIAARNGFAVGKRLPFPRSYMKVSIPSDSYDFRISFAGSGVIIDWGDGTTGTYSSSPATHSYDAGDYTIEIGDACTRFECPSSYGRTTITEVGFGENVTSIADAGFRSATSLVKIACAPSVQTAVNNTFAGSLALDWVCDFPLLNIPASRFSFIPGNSYVHIGEFSVQQYPGAIYSPIMHGAPVDHMTLMPALLESDSMRGMGSDKIRRVTFPVLTTLAVDAFYGMKNLYGVNCPACTTINACLTRSSSAMTNNPLGVTHIRLGHLRTGYSPFQNRNLCWGGSENYLGVFMVNMTRAELSDWLANLSVANFISQSAFEQKAICTDDSEWNAWNAWFEGGMQIDSVPTFPLSR